MDSLIDRIRRSIAQRGFLGTVPMCWSQFSAFFRRAARRAEAERIEVDVAFDAVNGVDTGGVVRPRSDSVVGRNWSFGVSYQAVDPTAFVDALREPGICYPDFTFIDFGSGKGRALLLASTFPFRRIIGVEYCEELNQIARRNLERYPEARRCRQIEVVGADAAEYAVPDDPLLLFFYHPFDKPVMAAVVQNVAESWWRNPRRMVVIYFTPYFADLWEQTGFLSRTRSAPAIFESNAAV